MAEQNHTQGARRKFCEEFKRDALHITSSGSARAVDPG
jgi:hypothetical protein